MSCLFLVALLILPMGWLYADGKPIIISPLSHTKPYMVAQLDNELYFIFLLDSGTEFGRNGRHAILQLVGDRAQQVAATIW
jgi:hypothetical protein